jgi:branched-chain amino acid transport system ATP-binding protein
MFSSRIDEAMEGTGGPAQARAMPPREGNDEVHANEIPALSLESVRFRYGALQALRGVSITVDPGEAVGIIGVNGAGKSTLLKVVAGALRGYEGECRAFGELCEGSGIRGRMRRGIVLVPEGRLVIGRLSVEDNLALGCSHLGARRPPVEALAFAFEVFPELDSLRDRSVGSLSGGQQQMVAVARSLVAGPRVLLLDEPSLGLAPVVQERLRESFQVLHERGITLVVVEQNLAFARLVTTRLYALVQGAVRFEGSWEEFSTSEDILRQYL